MSSLFSGIRILAPDVTYTSRNVLVSLPLLKTAALNIVMSHVVHESVSIFISPVVESLEIIIGALYGHSSSSALVLSFTVILISLHDKFDKASGCVKRIS